MSYNDKAWIKWKKEREDHELGRRGRVNGSRANDNGYKRFLQKKAKKEEKERRARDERARAQRGREKWLHQQEQKEQDRRARQKRKEAEAKANRAAHNSSSSGSFWGTSSPSTSSSGSFWGTSPKPKPSSSFWGSPPKPTSGGKDGSGGSSSKNIGGFILIVLILVLIGNLLPDDTNSKSSIFSATGADGTVKYQSGLYLREGPGLEYAQVDLGSTTRAMPWGSKLEILSYSKGLEYVDGEPGRWCKVRYKGKIGWAWGGGIIRHY